MEQVFDQVSLLLKKHAAARQRRLHIRTYKVLPLSASSGIIEFVRNTVPLGDYIFPAHKKYHPEDYLTSKCREELASIQQQTKDPKSILTVYKKIIASFHPVLHFFFLERFLDPDEWFNRRLAYTRTTAAISMLGHVLGLGDRHCQNILLDQKTGEAVHIDLGVAFEAGRILPVPEVVPFRLTPDIVSAMGYTKTEGIFRRCCEFTLDALREERESIMTLLNVLRYDPLVNWTVSPLKAKRMQNNLEANEDDEDPAVFAKGKGESDEDEGQAGRALMVVERKLNKMLSTAATVNQLIQQASDEANLAVLYPGWAPWA
jgi:ataxia telangiectasia mutated family protein